MDVQGGLGHSSVRSCIKGKERRISGGGDRLVMEDGRTPAGGFIL